MVFSLEDNQNNSWEPLICIQHKNVQYIGLLGQKRQAFNKGPNANSSRGIRKDTLTPPASPSNYAAHHLNTIVSAYLCSKYIAVTFCHI